MQGYIASRRLHPGWETPLKFAMLCTDQAIVIPEVTFPDQRTRLIGQIVATADLTGQMADRFYLEKLLFLYLEFREANLGDYQNVQDLLNKTRRFYAITRQKLDDELDGIYTKLALHFKELYGEERNCYVESIEKNIAYLSEITSLDEARYLAMLKRGGIVEKAINLIAPGNLT